LCRSEQCSYLDVISESDSLIAPLCQTIGTMLIEIWERLRGYDKWIQTEATIGSSQLAQAPLAPINTGGKNPPADTRTLEWRSVCTLAWKDGSGRQYTGTYRVSDNSPLFQLYDGQTVSIRYSPANPTEFYLPGVQKSRAVSLFKWALLTLFGIVVTTLISLALMSLAH